MTKIRVSLELRVVGVDLFHHSQAFLHNLLFQPIFLVLVQIRILSDHIIRALQYLPYIARTTHPVLYHHCATVKSTKSMPICYCAHPHRTICWVDASCHIQSGCDLFGSIGQLVLYGLPRVTTKWLVVRFAVGRTLQTCQFISIIVKYLLN